MSFCTAISGNEFTAVCHDDSDAIGLKKERTPWVVSFPIFASGRRLFDDVD